MSHRPKAKGVNMSSFDLLHSGVRRSIGRQDYTKLFTKIRISQPKRQSFLPSSGRDAQEEFQAGNARLRQKIKELESANAQLSAVVSKEHKLEGLLAKRIGSQDLPELTFDKAMEIKLMLEADALQEILKQKERLLDSTAKDYREREETCRNFSDNGEVELYAVLYDDETMVGRLLKEKEQVVEQQQEKIIKIRQKVQRVREVRRIRAEELKEMERQVDKAKQSLPSVSKITDENDSGLYGTQVRVKTTEILEMEIERMHQERVAFEVRIQQLIEQKVKDKIEVLKVINQFENQMISHRQQPR